MRKFVAKLQHRQAPVASLVAPPDQAGPVGASATKSSSTYDSKLGASKSRWAKAAEKLELEKPDVHAKLLRQNVDHVTDRQWKLRWGGHSLRVRVIAQSIASLLTAVKDVGTTAAGLDPVHAGIPVAAFCALLPLITGLTSQEDAAASAMQAVSAITSYYIAFEEAIERELAGKFAPDLEAHLLDLYASILELLVVVNCFFKKTTLERYARSVPKLDDFDGMLNDISDRNSRCHKFIDSIQQSEMRAEVIEIKRLTDKLVALTEDREKTQERILFWLSNIRFGADHEAALAKLGALYHNSGDWIRASPQYLAWRHQTARTGDTIWFRGHVGTGKTSMMAILVQQHLNTIRTSSQERVAYVYCSNKQEVANNGLSLLRCLISQLAFNNDGSSLSKLITDMYQAANGPAGSGLPDAARCKSLLVELLEQPKKVTIYIDALDECPDEEAEFLLEALHDVMSLTKGLTSLFLTSRMHVAVQNYFPDSEIIDPDGNRDDIQSFIQNEMALHRKRFLNGTRPDLEERLVKILVEKSENVFRWTELQLSLFLSRKYRLTHPADVEARLDALESQHNPGLPDLNSVYDEIWKMNTPQRHIKDIAVRVLRWLLAGRVPIDSHDKRTEAQGAVALQAAADMALFHNLIFAVSLKPDGTSDSSVTKELILDVCSNLVLENTAAECFQFAHLSVIEYLLSRVTPETGEHDMTPALISSTIAISSFAYLHRLIGGQHADTAPPNGRRPTMRPRLSRRHASEFLPSARHTFAQFVTVYWPLYYKTIPTSSQSQDVETMYAAVMLTDMPSDLFRAWLSEIKHQLWGAVLRPPDDGNHLSAYWAQTHLLAHIDPTELAVAPGQHLSRSFAAVFCDLVDVLEFIPQKEIEALNKNGDNCLTLAERWQKHDIANYLRNERGLEPIVHADEWKKFMDHPPTGRDDVSQAGGPETGASADSVTNIFFTFGKEKESEGNGDAHGF